MTPHPDERDLALYAGGDLDGKESAAVARHLDECAACRSVLADVRFTRDLLESACRETYAPADIREGVLNRIASRARTRRRLSFASAALASIAAILLLLVNSQPARSPATGPVILPRQAAPLPRLAVLNAATLKPEIPHRHLTSHRRPGIRHADLIARADGAPELRIDTTDPNVVILLQLKGTENQ